MDAETGLELFDRALLAGRSLSVALPLQERALRGLARAGLLPPILSGLVRVPARRSRAVPGSLTRRLSAASEEERERILLEVVREQVAASLGHVSADAVDVDSTLLELGMDSLGAVELRNRLAAVAEVQIPPTAAFDHPTTAALAAYLESLLAEHGGVAAGSSGDVTTTPTGTLRTLFASANRDGRTLEVARLLIDAAALRPVFESPAELEAPPRTIPISRQGEGPVLICVPSFLAGSGPHQFARIGQVLGGRRRIAAVALPGHGREELLPASWDAAVDALAISVLRAAEDDPFVLLGYSSGGAVAHALAERFERDGERLAGLAMVDSFLPEGDGLVELFGSTMGQLLEIDHEALAIDDQQLIAMGAYLRFAPQWSPGAVGVPGLMLRAADGLASMQPDSAELPAWQLPETTVELAGDHFSLIAEDAAATAEAIDGWLAERLEPDAVVGGER